MRFYRPALFLTTACCGFPAFAGDSLQDVLRNGKWLADMQIRHEYVEQEGFAEKAHANTARMRGGYQTGQFHGFSALAELELITHIGAPRFDDGVEGRTAYPKVNDPDDEALNRLFLQYDGWEGSRVTLGRFKLAFDNERFVGQSNFRQNDMTYDGISFFNESLTGLRLDYAYLSQTNRASGTHADLGKYEGDIHLLHAAYAVAPDVSLTAYGYLLGLEGPVTHLASQSYGLRLQGRYPLRDGMAWLYVLEGAVQQDYDNNPDDYETYYFHAAPGFAYGDATYTLGYEMLGGDGTNSFQTPIAGAHGHNGWADVFSTIPPEGLRDAYGSVAFAVPLPKDTRVTAQLHDYTSDTGGTHYGNEWGLDIAMKLTPQWTLGTQYADYHADTFGVDTAKAWVYARFTY